MTHRLQFITLSSIDMQVSIVFVNDICRMLATIYKRMQEDDEWRTTYILKISQCIRRASVTENSRDSFLSLQQIIT